MTLQGQGSATPVNEQHLTKIKATPSQAKKLRRDLIEAWLIFSGNANAENARRLSDVRLATEMFLREVGTQ